MAKNSQGVFSPCRGQSKDRKRRSAPISHLCEKVICSHGPFLNLFYLEEGEVSPSLRPACPSTCPLFSRFIPACPGTDPVGHRLAIGGVAADAVLPLSAGRQPRWPSRPPLFVMRCLLLITGIATSDTEAER